MLESRKEVDPEVKVVTDMTSLTERRDHMSVRGL